MDEPTPRKSNVPPIKETVPPDTAERIYNAIAMGATNLLAAKYGGISENTFYKWKKRYPPFRDGCDLAEGRAGIGWLAKIEKAANDGAWQAAAWKLERRYPEDYGRTVHDQRNYDMGTLSDADLEAIARGESPSRTGAA